MTAPATSTSAASLAFDLSHLSVYYDRIYPFDALFRWLSYSVDGDSDLFAKREFSMTMSRGSDEIYMRWQSFRSGAHFRERLTTMSLCPHKFDIGAVYTLPVSEKDGSGAHRFRPVSKELVFDIDMNDYDEIRTCCKEKKVCTKCWKFLALAIDVLETALREDFGFSHILWVFSGRRGVHCWVCDASARCLPSEGRAAVADYLNLVTGTAQQKKKIRFVGNRVHPMARRAYERSLPFFETLLQEQEFFARGAPLSDRVTDYLGDGKPALKENFKKLSGSWDGSSQGIWNILLSACQKRDEATPMELLLAFSYPRLDINVSKDVGHLLKAPFCVHQATGCICVPLPPKCRSHFDPIKDPPRLATVRSQYLETGDVYKTDLGPFLKYFEADFLSPLLAEVAATNPLKEIKKDAVKQEFSKAIATSCPPPCGVDW